MPKLRKDNKAPTKQDLKNAFKGQNFLITRKIDQLRAEMVTKKDAEKFVTKEDAKQFATKADLKQVATKQDLKQFVTKEDAKQFATKEDLRQLEERQNKKQEEYKQDIIREFHSSVEIKEANLQGAHEDEMAKVEGKKDAPPAWKSIPRRLKTVEDEVEKIKDTLEIS